MALRGKKPEATDEEPYEAEPSLELRQLWQHRYLAAIRVGLADPDACLFADAGLESHALTDLIDDGCPPATALRILL